MSPISSAPRRRLSDSPFLQWWLIYFGVIAYGWCALAGVGFILLIAFAGDSGRFDSQYFSTLLQVFLMLFVWPLIVIAMLSALLAIIHQGLIRPLWNRLKGRSSTQTSPPPLDFSQVQSRTNKPFVPQAALGDNLPTRPKLPALTIITCVTLNLIGTLMVVGNAPRSHKEYGLGPTLFTSLAFLIPLVVLPSFFLIRAIRRFYSRSRDLTKGNDTPQSST